MLPSYKETLYTSPSGDTVIYIRRNVARNRLRRYYIKQKLSGVILLLASVIAPVVLDGDATASVLLFPFGLYLVLTKDKVMMFKS